MRTTWLVVASMTLSACIEGDSCVTDGQSDTDMIVNFAPFARVGVRLTGCSTCGHTKVTAQWDNNFAEPGPVTGFIAIELAPGCFVRSNTANVDPNLGVGAVDNNYMNCGAVIDYDAYVDNMSNKVLNDVRLTMTCPTLVE